MFNTFQSASVSCARIPACPGRAQSIPGHNRTLTLPPPAQHYSPRPAHCDPGEMTSTRYCRGEAHPCYLNNVPGNQTRCSCWCCEESDWSRNPLSLCHLWGLTLMDWWRNYHSPPLLNFDGELFPDIFPSSLSPRSVSQEGRRAPQSRTSWARAGSTAPALPVETNFWWMIRM